MALPRNSARSGGPSTSRGVAMGSQNSLKTGVYSVQAILPGEDADAFEVLLQDLMADQQYEAGAGAGRGGADVE